jgi:hypothetical protein
LDVSYRLPTLEEFKAEFLHPTKTLSFILKATLFAVCIVAFEWSSFKKIALRWFMNHPRMRFRIRPFSTHKRLLIMRPYYVSILLIQLDRHTIALYESNNWKIITYSLN